MLLKINHAVRALLAAVIALTAGPALAVTVKNDCINSLTAKIYDQSDIVVVVPLATARNIPQNRHANVTGLAAGKEYKVRFTGACTKDVSINGEYGHCQDKNLNGWVHHVKSTDTLTCRK